MEIKGVDVESIPRYTLPKINIDEFLMEDLDDESLTKPFRFGKAIDVDIDFFKASRKIERQDSTLYYYGIREL
ncbi:hypothetical protein ADIS_0398 [Lunatimonas lonarensis]|uniref:Uncharacterized protein n=1 Tax=Lunatimonas lonarensis TaxID=1232681 RepID=R7ZYN8_9BACT|nr:hypothetical protein [Lunatimonas lonarensis]EON79169.1 hypothetical protein ADIS_0398 [Lunatimonas lonarensis]